MINRQQIQEIIDWYKSENAFLMRTDDLQMNQVNHTLYIAHETFIAKLQSLLDKDNTETELEIKASRMRWRGGV